MVYFSLDTKQNIHVIRQWYDFDVNVKLKYNAV